MSDDMSNKMTPIGSITAQLGERVTKLGRRQNRSRDRGAIRLHANQTRASIAAYRRTLPSATSRNGGRCSGIVFTPRLGGLAQLPIREETAELRLPSISW